MQKIYLLIFLMTFINFSSASQKKDSSTQTETENNSFSCQPMGDKKILMLRLESDWMRVNLLYNDYDCMKIETNVIDDKQRYELLYNLLWNYEKLLILNNPTLKFRNKS